NAVLQNFLSEISEPPKNIRTDTPLLSASVRKDGPMPGQREDGIYGKASSSICLRIGQLRSVLPDVRVRRRFYWQSVHSEVDGFAGSHVVLAGSGYRRSSSFDVRRAAQRYGTACIQREADSIHSGGC